MVNLLPPEIKIRYRLRSKVYSLALTYVVILTLLGVGLVALSTFNFVSQASISVKKSQLDELTHQLEAKKDLSDQAAFVEDRVKNAAKYQENRQWDQLLTDVAQATPTTIGLSGTHLEVTKDNNVLITVKGNATDRRDIILFQDKLQENKNLSDVTVQAIDEQVTNSGKALTFSLQATYHDPKATK